MSMSIANHLRFILGLLLLVLTGQVIAEDIEIFSNDESSLVGKPSVLIVLDNSANWSRQSQQWPGGLTQGQSEVRAIKNVINSLENESVNIGLMLHSTDGNSTTNDGGYLRYHIRPLTDEVKSELSEILDTIFNRINNPIEKRSSGNGFGTLFWDVYNYLGELEQSQSGAGTPGSIADNSAYLSQYSQFRSPLSVANNCSRTVVIFLGNNVNSGPSKDANAAVDALGAAQCSADDIPFADFEVTEAPLEVDLGFSTACYANAAECTLAESGDACTEQGFTACICDESTETACSLRKYEVLATSQTITQESDTTETTATAVATGEIGLTCVQDNKVGTYSCPAASVSTQTDTPMPGQQSRVTTTWSNCSYVLTGNAGCNGQKKNYEARGIRTTRTVVESVSNTTNSIGLNNSCSSSAASCSTAGIAECNDGTYSSCVCSDSNSSTDGCAGGATNTYQVTGQTTSIEATPTGSFSDPSGGPWAVDEWARCLRTRGVPLPGGTDSDRSQVSTYTVDVFNAQQNDNFSALLFNTARVGGGKYYQARNEDQITAALVDIFGEIQSVNTAFASASLPVNATNRAQSENQVYIGLFRPDRTKKPRWFGNLKRYQLILDNGITVELGDSRGRNAINNETGFISDCAASYWTQESGSYWLDSIADDPDAASQCPFAADAHSDFPDGPTVEKGGAAQVIRESNRDAGPDVNGDYSVVRNMFTRSGSSLASISAGALGVTTAQLNYFMGADTGLNPVDEDVDGVTLETRASIHGDVIHSRPQAINYGENGGVVVYYGANDGAFRAVRGDDGKELWSFIAPEHATLLPRLFANSPNVTLSGGTFGKPYFFDGSTGVYQVLSSNRTYIYPTMRRGGRAIYAFDVSSPNADPTLLGRVGCDTQTTDLFCTSGFTDIGQTWSTPKAATVRHTGGVKVPYLFFGGGYDTCEDANTGEPDCADSKGAGIYVMDVTLNTLVRHFDLNDEALNPGGGERGVASDVVFTDVNGDGTADHVYAATTGGALYRISFINNDVNRLPYDDPSQWTIHKLAETTGGGRKFLFNPFVLSTSSGTFIGIGSGDREHPLATHYPTTEDVVNRFYVVRDAFDDVTVDLDDTSVMVDYTIDPGCDEQSRITRSGDRRGWFVDLTANGPGEQVVTSPVVVAGAVFFSTNRPGSIDENSCTNNLGEARGYVLGLLNASGAISVDGTCGGDRFSDFGSGGLPPSPVVARVPITTDEGTVIKTVIIGGAEKDGTVSAIVGAQDLRPDVRSNRRPIAWSRNQDTD